jgi:hypothetical protein
LEGKTKPEIKQVAHDQQGFCTALKAAQKFQHQPVIVVSRLVQMGIGKKMVRMTGILLILSE